ncbi:septum site-determining protein MinC [Candidatus Kinetoplastibacterium blastocrithidii TCC012E]|uniref:Probable septum site-determining protein MinC n=1 Tax=Candidatus Kinetoplastidibacterium blastocrithidiae TCC012E TaxID=1208922 RepID=M1ME12_9PROT|nr:septum site-determining protein MinC [Candidatus Kinetoplastibacterium blastocrithidii]AFZ83846.1 septum site-determining protein MinC [Candidatus Kinetoplastibacterium blastocrithidii (ex Strigomonas culicis)]AGF49970.1 septum site-determining protein MinC [Candidatus Kinetoplastibacterium blastocrithidii TCC012E]
MIIKPSKIDCKSANIVAPRLILQDGSDDLYISIETYLKNSGDFFVNEYIIIDARQLVKSVNWDQLIGILKIHSISVLGILANGDNLISALDKGLINISSGKEEIYNSNDLSYHKDTKNNNRKLGTLLIDKPLRSGQKIYANEKDLIVIGMVSPGAEIIADGNIHVYGPLRGKAIAGANGDTDSRIFTTQFDAELLAIAGIYKIFDNNLNGDMYNKKLFAKLQNEKITIKLL